MQLFYKQYGAETPPLIILHGLLGAHGNWHTLSRNVFSDHATVYAVDQRNHGRSPHADVIDYPHMADDLKAFIEEHDLSDVTVLGHSMGGKTAMEAALRYPTLIDKLIVVDMAPRAYPPNHQAFINALQSIDPSDYDSRSDIDEALAEAVPSWDMRQFLLKNLSYNNDTYHWMPNLAAIDAHYDALVGPVEADGRYTKPALFIRGGNSTYVSDHDWPAIQERFPNATLVTIPDAGHWVHAEAPEALSDAVIRLLDA
jgi:pimeloyl-ACP methyl ester carboxylesterase